MAKLESHSVHVRVSVDECAHLSRAFAAMSEYGHGGIAVDSPNGLTTLHFTCSGKESR